MSKKRQNSERENGGVTSGGYTAAELGRESSYDDVTSFAKQMRRGNRLIKKREDRHRSDESVRSRKRG